MNNMQNGQMQNQIKANNTSAKKANDGISNLLNIIASNLGDDTSRGNASTIYNIAKFFL